MKTKERARMQSPPLSQAEIAARISSHLDELLELWWAEQGASKPKDLELIASSTTVISAVSPSARTLSVTVLVACRAALSTRLRTARCR